MGSPPILPASLRQAEISQANPGSIELEGSFYANLGSPEHEVQYDYALWSR